MIIGCIVKSGVIQNKVKVRVQRKGELIGEVQITSLQKGQESVSEVKEGTECGIKVQGPIKVEEGDILMPYKIEKKIRTL